MGYGNKFAVTSVRETLTLKVVLEERRLIHNLSVPTSARALLPEYNVALNRRRTWI